MPLLSGGGNLGGLLVWAQPAAPSEPEWFEVQVTTTAPNQPYSWQSGAGTSPNHITEWGDGTTTTHTANGSYTHTYANAGTYTLRIKCAWASNGAFNMRPATDRVRLTRLLTPIPAFSDLISIANLCNGCTGLTGAIPGDFLRYATNLTNVSNFLNGCPNMTGDIPVDLFRYVTNATVFSGAFLNSVRLRIQPDIFGTSPTTRFLNQSPTFSTMFRNTGTAAVQGTAPAMWTYDYGTGTPTTSGAFVLQSASTLSNYNDIPVDWR